MAKKTKTKAEPTAEKQFSSKQSNKNQKSGGLNINYLTKMGLKNLISHHSMTLSSVSVLTACLLLIGVSMMILFNIQSMVKQVESQNVVIAFVEKGLDEVATAQVGEDLKNVTNVSSVEFVSKEDAFVDQLESYGVEAESFKNLLENPLPDCYHVTVTDLENFDVTLASIKNVQNISSIRESQELVGQITALQKSVSAICAIIVILLFVVSVFIITNTIKITMVYRKIDIQVMKSVGATNTFVRWPFIVEGVVIGVFSALLALGLTYGVEKLEGNALSSFITLFGGETVSIFDYWPVLVLCYIGGGLIIGIFGSIVTMAKYLRKEGSEANEI